MPVLMWKMKGSPQLRCRIPLGKTLSAAGRRWGSWSIAISATPEARTTSASARAPLGIGSQGFPRGGGGGRPAFPLRTPRGTVLPRHFPTFPGVSVLVPLDLPGCAGPRRPLRAAAGRAGGAPGDVRRHRHCGEDGEAAQIPPGALG